MKISAILTLTAIGTWAYESLECNFKLEIVQLQDASSSFGELLRSQKEVIGEVFNAFRQQYSDVAYGIASWVDKPIVGKGLSYYGGQQEAFFEPDWCYRVEAELTDDSILIQNTIERMAAALGSGGDSPENPLEGLIALANDEAIGFKTVSDPDIIRIALLLTDDVPQMPGAAQKGIDLWNSPREYASDGSHIGLGFGSPSLLEEYYYINYWLGEEYLELCEYYRRFDNGEGMTADDFERFERLKTTFGPEVAASVGPHPGDYSLDCATTEYPSTVQTGFAVQKANLHPIFLTLPPPWVDFELSDYCWDNGFGDLFGEGVDPERVSECLVHYYTQVADEMGVKPFSYGLTDVLLIADSIIDAVWELSSQLCEDRKLATSTSTESAAAESSSNGDTTVTSTAEITTDLHITTSSAGIQPTTTSERSDLKTEHFSNGPSTEEIEPAKTDAAASIEITAGSTYKEPASEWIPRSTGAESSSTMTTRYSEVSTTASEWIQPSTGEESSSTMTTTYAGVPTTGDAASEWIPRSTGQESWGAMTTPYSEVPTTGDEASELIQRSTGEEPLSTMTTTYAGVPTTGDAASEWTQRSTGEESSKTTTTTYSEAPTTGDAASEWIQRSTGEESSSTMTTAYFEVPTTGDAASEWIQRSTGEKSSSTMTTTYSEVATTGDARSVSRSSETSSEKPSGGEGTGEVSSFRSEYGEGKSENTYEATSDNGPGDIMTTHGSSHTNSPSKELTATSEVPTTGDARSAPLSSQTSFEQSSGGEGTEKVSSFQSGHGEGRTELSKASEITYRVSETTSANKSDDIVATHELPHTDRVSETTSANESDDVVTTHEPRHTDNASKELTASEQGGNSSGWEDTTGSEMVVAVLPPPGSNGAVIAGAAAGVGAVVLAAAVWLKAGFLFKNRTPTSESEQQVCVPENPAERETMEEITMDMYT